MTTILVIGKGAEAKASFELTILQSGVTFGVKTGTLELLFYFLGMFYPL